MAVRPRLIQFFKRLDEDFASAGVEGHDDTAASFVTGSISYTADLVGFEGAAGKYN